ncbi:MAG: hypothetical protein IT200_08910 [Thermoleophilia bacterium]|nr:hypothetical protein [Thermoleophilia bacterium]
MSGGKTASRVRGGALTWVVTAVCLALAGVVAAGAWPGTTTVPIAASGVVTGVFLAVRAARSRGVGRWVWAFLAASQWAFVAGDLW